MSDIDQIDKALNIINNNLYLSLASCDDNNMPWIAPLYYVTDTELNFYFHSQLNSHHAQHIKKRENVAFCIFDSTLTSRHCTGLQMTGRGVEVNDVEELQKIIPIYYKKANQSDPGLWSEEWQSINAYTNSAKRRFYKIKTDSIFIPHGELDARQALDLKELRGTRETQLNEET
jgi:uncharacterized protein YhbP (UPF0306 family)